MVIAHAPKAIQTMPRVATAYMPSGKTRLHYVGWYRRGRHTRCRHTPKTTSNGIHQVAPGLPRIAKGTRSGDAYQHGVRGEIHDQRQRRQRAVAEDEEGVRDDPVAITSAKEPG